jgi:antirestriction protein ArdC
MKTEEAKTLIEQQIEALGTALEAGHSQQLQEFLGIMARFHKYSLGNVLLIMAQRPEASQVAGFHTWKSLGRFVKAGEKGIAILAPMALKRDKHDSSDSSPPEEDEDRILRFRVVYVFDINQTDGEPLPEFAQVQGEPGEYSDRLKNLVRQMNIELEYSDQLGGALGVSKGGSIVLKEGLDPAHEFTTLVHELAHEILHHGDGRTGTTKQSRELQAEAVAFVVAQAIGLDTGTASSDYIQLYQGDKQLLTEHLDAVRKAAGTILDGLAS